MENDKINKKSQRLRLYLAETAKEIILKSGIKDITIRKIAAEAGYAYATIYNHFENLDELLWMTRSLFIDEIGEYVEKNSVHQVKSNDDVYDIFKTYVTYYLSNPDVYYFLYFYPLNKESKTTTTYIETTEYQSQFLKSFEHLANTKTKAEIAKASKAVLYSIHGLLTLCFANNDDLGFDDIYSELKSIIEYVLK